MNRFFDPDEFTAHAQAKSLRSSEEVLGALAGFLAQRSEAAHGELQKTIAIQGETIRGLLQRVERADQTLSGLTKRLAAQERKA